MVLKLCFTKHEMCESTHTSENSFKSLQFTGLKYPGILKQVSMKYKRQIVFNKIQVENIASYIFHLGTLCP